MKPFNSIKWRLQLWYGLILVVLLAGFGTTAYQLERNRQLRQIDDEMHRRINILGVALRRQNPRNRNLNRVPPGQPPRGQEDQFLPPDELPLDPLPEDAPRFRNELLARNFSLPPEYAPLFDASDPNGFYYVMAARDGRPLARSTNAPEHLLFDLQDMAKSIPALGGQARRMGPEFTDPEPPRMQGVRRELINVLPTGDTILVGCSVLPKLKELRRTAFNLTAVGGVVLVIGLTGGWWFVGRAMRPITGISGTAAKISAGDLSQRIDVSETESELGELASVLNATFARLEAAFAQQKQFASDAAHELRTPVTVILTQTQAALARERDAGSYRQTVEACQRAAQRMRRLIETLLELTRYDAGQEVLKRLKIDLSEIARDSLELVQPLAEERHVKLTGELVAVPLTGDPERLSQVLVNLLTNAVQFSRPEGKVRVTLGAENGLAVLTVADHGQGIAAEDLPRVFERFYRADKSRAGGGNSGLGLAIAKVIVEAHGGSINVTSEPGAGSVFTVRLPQ